MNVTLPKILKPMTQPYRYKFLYGGRGGAKSWSIAKLLLLKGVEQPLRILCAREIQKSIQDSVHQLLTDQIIEMGLQDFYQVKKSEIVGKNGTRFGFEGLKHNITNLKSWEGADICWVEEAHVVSKASWDILIPTIRRENSEIWGSFNPELAEDETYQRFVVDPPPNSFIQKVNYSDNPWFPDVLRAEMEHLKEKDYNAYLNVWEGHCKAAIEGAIFAKELEKATEEGRIMHVPYNNAKPVDCFLDLGYSDQTAIWFGQMIGFEHHFLKYYANSGEKANHYIKYLKDQEYTYGTIFLPHDADHEQLGQEKTIVQQFRAAFPNVRVVVVPRVSSKANSIEAARSIFSNSYFDKELCADGLGCLRRYCYIVDPENGKISKQPKHDIYSHGADAFQCAGMAMKGEKKPRPTKRRESVGWQAMAGI